MREGAAREPGQRRIDAAQFAFVRAVVLGIPMREAADRYLGDGLDMRVVQTELRRLRTELLVAARRGGAFGDARALQLDIAQIPASLRDAPPAVPSLEDFRDRVDPDGFHGEAELLELFQEQHPAAGGDRRMARLARLRERQRRALDMLERVLVLPPSLDDPPSAWLEPATARRMEAVDCTLMKSSGAWAFSIKRSHSCGIIMPHLLRVPHGALLACRTTVLLASLNSSSSGASFRTAGVSRCQRFTV